MASVDATGSQKLLSSVLSKGSAATPEEVKAALAIPATVDYKLIRYFPRGIPPVYQELEAAFEVSPAQLPELVSQLAAHPAIGNLNVLVRGIPPVVKVAEVSAVLGAA